MNISKYYIKNNRFKYGKLKNLDIRDYDGIKLYVPWRIRMMEKETRKLVDVFQGTSLYIDVYYREGIYLVTHRPPDRRRQRCQPRIVGRLAEPLHGPQVCISHFP